MAFAHVIANRPSPYRLQVVLDDVTGPLISSALGYFDPRRDLVVYNAGRIVTIKSFTWDPARNRYLLFLAKALDFSSTPDRGGIVVRITTVPFFRHFSTTARSCLS